LTFKELGENLIDIPDAGKVKFHKPNRPAGGIIPGRKEKKMKPFYGRGTDAPNEPRHGEHYDFFVPVASVPSWAYEEIEENNIRIRKLLADLEARQELQVIESGGWGDGYSYYVKFFDEEECFPLSELAYNDEIGLHRIPESLFRCDRCGKEKTFRAPRKKYNSPFSRRDKCRHEWRPVEK